MLPLIHKLVIEQGRTLRLPLRWEKDEWAYVPVAAITKGAPCRVTTSTPHGMPDGWRCAVVSAGGMAEVNAAGNPPSDDELRRVKVVTANQIEFNDLNSSDFTPYTSGGYLQYRLPEDLAGATARMTIKDKVGGTELLSLTTENGRILIDSTNKVIELVLLASITAGLTWRSGVYDLELISATQSVKALLKGGVSVVPEVTT